MSEKADIGLADRLIPGVPRLTALQALPDLYRTLDDAEGGAWLDDIRAD